MYGHGKTPIPGNIKVTVFKVQVKLRASPFNWLLRMQICLTDEQVTFNGASPWSIMTKWKKIIFIVMNVSIKHSSWKIKTSTLILQLNSYGGINLIILEIPITDSLVMPNFWSNFRVQRLDFILINTHRQSLLMHPSIFPITGTITYFVIKTRASWS